MVWVKSNSHPAAGWLYVKEVLMLPGALPSGLVSMSLNMESEHRMRWVFLSHQGFNSQRDPHALSLQGNVEAHDAVWCLPFQLPMSSPTLLIEHIGAVK